MKRAAARKKIERYFYQLTDGCGNPNCSNEFCASSGQLKDLSANQAAAQALELFAKEVPLCESRLHPAKIARTLPGGDSGSGGGAGGSSLSESDISSVEGSSNSSTGSTPDNNSASVSGECSGCAGTSAAVDMGLPTHDADKMASEGIGEAKSNDIVVESVPFLTEQKLFDIIDDCEETKNFAKLIRTLGEVYSSIGSVASSFLQLPSSTSSESPIDPFTSELTSSDPLPTPLPCTPATKEHLRSLEGERDKDVDSLSPAPTPLHLTTVASRARAGWQSTFAGVAPSTILSSTSSRRSTNAQMRPPVDLAAIRRAYRMLFAIPGAVFESALVTALVTLAGYLQIELQRWSGEFTEQDVVNVLVAVFEIPALGSGDFLETAFPALCRAVNWLPVSIQAQLAHVWSAPTGRSSLRLILENLQQLVTLRVILTQFHPDYYVQEENIVTSATKLMKVLYYANMLAGELESPDLREDDIISDDNYLGIKVPQTPPPADPLAVELGLSVLDCRKPFLPFSEFYNEPLSEVVEMDRDFANYKSDTGKFCFMNYAFILTPATKTMGLYFDNRIRMYSERRISYFQSVSGQPSNPYLRLKVRRDHIIDDALVELEMISMENPVDLKKQLVVEFEGEQGIDEGGVSKEFFQLVIEEIFNPDYAMFSCQADTQTMWFNPTSFETDAQFTLIGIVLGLAIYNNIILAVNFPMVLYRKLMGKKGSFEDLQDWNPVLYNSLCSLLEYPNPDLDDIYLQTFRISYSDVFGTLHTHDLRQDGDTIPVTQENKHEFVNSYADFLLNISVEKQFRAFSKGFQMVTDESPLKLLFRPEEVELLICGSKNFDFRELESSTEYDGGYTSTTPIIEQFWSITHALSLEDKRKLLQFATGSDRVPIGGLAKLKLVIARNGPDSNRLPTAHTCFNVLLLPEYTNREKLEDRLLKAINYSKGFGML